MQTDNPTTDILSDIVQAPPVAPIGKRIAAALIDGAILLVILAIMGNLFGERYSTSTTITTTTADTTITTNNFTRSSGFYLTGIPALVYMIGWFFLIPFSEGRTGQTLGKRALGIRVLKQNDDPTNVGLSFVRHLFDGIDCFFLIGLIIASTNKERKRIGDLVAGTHVVEKARAAH
jgi:uncharacterized RDD family membrane protein YckC